MKPLRPLFKWFGSSWSSAKHYPAPLPRLPVFEPFAGSAGYSLNHFESNVVLWEVNPLLQELWCWLIYHATSQDILDIPLNLPEATDIRTLQLSWGQKLLLKNWQRTNNVGNCWTVSKWGHLPGQFTANTRARVADQVNAIKHWQFRPIDWTETGTYLCDSPYIYNYPYGIKNFDYQKYVINVLGLPANSMAICCEAACSKTGAVPNYLPFEPSHRQVTSRRKSTQSHHSKELVYIHRT